MGDFFAIVLVLILLLVFFAFLSWLAYLVIYLPTAWLIKSNRLRTVRLILSPLTVILVIIIFFASRPSAGNDDTATIEAIGDDYQIILKGQRLLMVHDPISALMGETYTDSVIMIIPRADGIIDGHEIQRSGYKTVGTLKIDKEEVIVDLYYENTSDKREPLSWNGDYKLKWKSDN
jgi:hypothetical protein